MNLGRDLESAVVGRMLGEMQLRNAARQRNTWV